MKKRQNMLKINTAATRISTLSLSPLVMVINADQQETEQRVPPMRSNNFNEYCKIKKPFKEVKINTTNCGV